MPASVLAAAQNQLYLYSQLSDVSSFKYLSQTLYVFALVLWASSLYLSLPKSQNCSRMERLSKG